MKYIAKGLVEQGSTEHILKIQRGGHTFQLTGIQAGLWLNGRFGFAKVEENNPWHRKELRHLQRMGLAEVTEDSDAGEYRALTQCVLIPAKPGKLRLPLNKQEAQTLQWLREAGLRLTMAELVSLEEHGVKPVPELLGEENSQALTETIYTQENIQDTILEAQMEHAFCRDRVVKAVLGLLKKRRVLVL